MRNSHPLDFVSELLQKTYSVINVIAEKHAIWRLQSENDGTMSEGLLVPHGVKLFVERNGQASTCTVTRMGTGGVVIASYERGGSLEYRSKKVVDMDKSTCTCGMWNVDKFPCACAIAVAVSHGKVASVFVSTNCHHSYYIQDEALMTIAKALKPVLAPTSDELQVTSQLSSDNDVLQTILPPPKRTKETHGKNKRKRKESSKKASTTTGRTHTRSYACVSSSLPKRKEARQICSLCVRNGRVVPKELWHKAKCCPYKVVNEAKCPLQVPAMTRLRSQNKMSYKNGVPRREQKPRILSCVAGEPIVWVKE